METRSASRACVPPLAGHHRGAAVVPPDDSCRVLPRALRLGTLADRLDRTLAHKLVDLAPLAWHGQDATRAVQQLRACLIEIKVAAAGLRQTATFQQYGEHPVPTDGTAP